MVDEAKQFLNAIKKPNEARPMDVRIIQTGLGAERITAKLQDVCVEPPNAIVVAGTAAGINQDYLPGDIVIYSRVINHSGQLLDLTPGLTERLRAALVETQPKLGVGYTSSKAVTTFGEKAALRTRFQADCIDMETAAVVEFANQRAIPIAAVRIIVDPFDQAIPIAAIAGLNQDGSTNARGTIGALIKGPRQIFELLKIARQYSCAMKSLARAARLLVRNLASNAVSHSATN
jgi:hypothetical protein